MSTDADGPNESPHRHEPSSAERLHIQLRRFVDSMDAVESLSRFAHEHSTTLDDEVSAIVEQASRHFPNYRDDEHRQVAAVVLESCGQLDEISEAMSADGRRVPDGSEKAARMEIRRQMEESVKGILGTSSPTWHYFVAYVKQRHRPGRAALLRSSLLVSAVANFEVLVAAQLRFFFDVRPEALRTKDAIYSLQEISKHDSIDDFLATCAAAKVEGILRESFDSWMMFLDKRVGVDIGNCSRQVSAAAEVFQRRHLFVHNGGVVNSQYLSNVGKHADEMPAIGTRLTVHPDYLADSLASLTVLGILVSANMLREYGEYGADESEKSYGFDVAADYSYNCLIAGSPGIVAQICEPAAAWCTNDYARLIFRVNLWLARKRLSGIEEIRTEVRSWQVAALAPEFRLARHALLDELDEALVLAKELLASGALSEEYWLSWPLLEDVRQLALASPELSASLPGEATCLETSSPK